MFIRSLAALLFGSMVVGCGAADVDDASGSDTSEAEGELRASSVKSFVAGRSSGFVHSPRPVFCTTTEYAYEMSSRSLTAQLCRGGQPATISTQVTKADAKKIKSALAQITTAPKPTSCPTDVPVSYLDVKRASSETHFVDARSACGGGNTAAEKEGLDHLLEVLGLISSAAEEAP